MFKYANNDQPNDMPEVPIEKAEFHVAVGIFKSLFKVGGYQTQTHVFQYNKDILILEDILN